MAAENSAACGGRNDVEFRRTGDLFRLLGLRFLAETWTSLLRRGWAAKAARSYVREA
jgi:hypothetical protein